MQILVLSARPDTASNVRLAEAGAAAGISLELVDATKLAVGHHGEVYRGINPLFEQAPDGVLARVGNWRPDSMLALLEVMTSRGVATPNPAPAIRIGRDHWRTAQVLAEAGLPVPLTLAGADPEVLAAAAKNHLQFPVVVKQRRSRMGVGVIRCRSLDHLEGVLDSLWRVGDELVVQQYHETGSCSFRLFVVGSKVVAAARFSAADGEWRSNATRGGQVEGLSPGNEAIGLAVAATRSVGLGICGVDLLPTRDGILVGELNPTPGFVNLERATGVDVARAIVDHMMTLGR